jgi:6-phosphofructokinase 1
MTRGIFIVVASVVLSILPSIDGAAFVAPVQKYWRTKQLLTTTGLEESPLSEDKDTAEVCFDAGYVRDKASFVTVSEVFVAELETLTDRFPSCDKCGNVMKYAKRKRSTREDSVSTSSHENMEYNQLISERELILVDVVRKEGMTSMSRGFVRAGPREKLHFDPAKVNAAIVTCGGLCPGLNNVIRELVHSLNYLYGANTVYGITGGFNGFHMPEYEPVILTNEIVENIHHDGGTILRSSRGGFDLELIMQFLKEKDISQLYIIGGDGTHRGAFALHEACMAEGLNIAVAGIPKTIDNDVDYIDRSFGFGSAVEAAQNGIRVAKTEAMCNLPRGIGIIKLMGRSAGFLAAFAALGSGDVDLVLVPEVPIVLEGPDGILPYLRRRIKEQKYAVVVVAEGAGEELLGTSKKTDAGGNKALPKIGEYLKEKIGDYFDGIGESATIKFIDPSYLVRSVPANAADSLYCMQLAQNAVHGAMAGFTGFTSGLVNNHMVMLPIPLVVATSPRQMNPNGKTWERIIAMTGQPNTAAPKTEKEVNVLCLPEPMIR